MWLVGPWVTSSIGAEWHSSKWVSMSYLCWALEGRAVGHGGPSSSSCTVLPVFYLIFMCPRHKTALASKPSIKLG